MMMIFKIARTELKNLFYSPVAWFLAVAFMVQCAVFYFEPLMQASNWQNVLLKNMPKFKNLGEPLTKVMFMDVDGLFVNALKNLYLFIPLLTMGLISAEVNSGTIKLLFSSPVTTREIVLGKYLAMMLYNLVLVGIIGIFVILAALHIQHTDFGFLLAALLGFYLLVCAYAAIGLFMSSLSNYQIVAAIGTFILILVLSRIGTLWQKYPIINDLTYFLSMAGRTGKMLKGLITTKDLFYFVLIIIMFVEFTVIKMNSSRESKSWMLKAARYAGVLLIVLILGYFSSRPGMIGYWDTTALKENTLNTRTQEIVKQLDKGPLEATLYVNLFGFGTGRTLPEHKNKYLDELWDSYLRFKPDINFKYVYYYDVDDDDSTRYKALPGKSLAEIAEITSKGMDQSVSLFIPPAEVRKMVNLDAERKSAVIELKYNGQRTFVRIFNDIDFWPGEEQMAPALKRLAKVKPPKLLFLTGNYERNIYNQSERDYWSLVTRRDSRGSLVNYGFEYDTLSAGNEVPEGITALVLADPKSALDAVSRKHIQNYIDKGGNMLILGEPGKQSILNPVLSPIGVQLQAGSLVEINKYQSPSTIAPYVTSNITQLMPDKFGQGYVDALVEKDTVQNPYMYGAAALVQSDSSDFKANTIFATMPDRAWVRVKPLVTDSAAPVYSPNEGDTKSHSYNAGMALTRMFGKKEQRIFVGADADFMNTLRDKGNIMNRAIFAWLSSGEYPVWGNFDKPKDMLLRLNITDSVAKGYHIIFLWVIPGLIALFATIFLIRRKRQ